MVQSYVPAIMSMSALHRGGHRIGERVSRCVDYNYEKNLERVFPPQPSRDLARSPRGGLTRERNAGGSPSLVEQSVGTGVPTHTPGQALSNSATGCSPLRRADKLLADDSASSADATTALPTGSSVNDGGDSAAPLCHMSGMAVGQRRRGRQSLHG